MTPHPPKGAPGFYWEVEVELSPESEELWGLFCYDRGAVGAECLREAPGAATFRYFFGAAEPEGVSHWEEEFRRDFPGVEPPRRVVLSRREIENWQESWRAHFMPTPAGREFVVCPPWAVPSGEALADRRPLLIEPGQGFGTGGHESTVLAIGEIERLANEAAAAAEAPPAAMLDVGIGSGILSVAARMMGVVEGWGLDIDPRVIPEVRRNFALNGLAPAPRMALGTPACLSGSFPLVVANLTAPVLLEHRAHLTRLTARAGSLILSGVLGRESEGVLRAYLGGGCRLQHTAERERWWACRLTRSA